ncbi:hypothetical protein [Geodermatophilus sp. DSM 44513]|uniref:hypothetical protein n=1 Tax=Geodermatophilus sp. DSM 44513 TaxID=1528104 RepID=UPI00127D018B|nr:hypothetical protein [Geodermatophilus sp. DSM 44513]WNV77381.1 hypothetical protein RTG05_08910 [Geodermatophilus sp. DSM 44513]
MPRTVDLMATFLPDRSLRLTAQGDHGPIELATGVRYSELGPRATAAVRELFPGEDATPAPLVAAPPWVHLGDLVRIHSTSDTLEGTTTPYAQVVGFLPVGGVQVVHSEAGAGIYSPDDLDVVGADAIDPAWRARIARRSGIPPAG